MAVSVIPTDYIPSYSSDGTNITIPIASLSGLTTGHANTTTGDIRYILMAILDTLNTANVTDPLTSGGSPSTTLTITKTQTINDVFFSAQLTAGSIAVTLPTP